MGAGALFRPAHDAREVGRPQARTIQWPRAMLLLSIAALLAIAVWLRVATLGSVPLHNGDESYYGTQAARLLGGHACRLQTMSGNLLNPFLLGAEALVHLVAPPSVVALRVPAVACGLLAIGMAYWLCRRPLGRDVSTIAAIYLAALPVAVMYSRVGLEQSQVPLAGLLALVAAFRGSGVGLLGAMIAALLVHPVNILLTPILAPVYLANLARRHEGDPARLRRAIAVSLSGLGALCAIVVAWLIRRPVVQGAMSRRIHLPGLEEWSTFLDGFAGNLLQLPIGVSDPVSSMRRWVFWCVLTLAAVIGVPILMRRRKWDQLALVGSLIVTVSVFHAVLDAKLSRLGGHRYAAPFIMPLVLAFACLVGAAIDAIGARGSNGAARFARGIALAGAWVLLLVGPPWSLVRSLGMPRASSADPFAVVLQTVSRDDRADAPSRPPRRLLLAEDYWTSRPLEYLSARRGDIVVAELLAPLDLWRALQGGPAAIENRLRWVRANLSAGGYAAGPVGGIVDLTARRDFPADRLKTWQIPDPAGGPPLRVFRVREATPSRVATSRR